MIKITTFDADGRKTAEIEADSESRFDISVRDMTLFVERPIVETRVVGADAGPVIGTSCLSDEDVARLTAAFKRSGYQRPPVSPPPAPPKRRR